jgi:hypothetical protein
MNRVTGLIRRGRRLTESASVENAERGDEESAGISWSLAAMPQTDKFAEPVKRILAAHSSRLLHLTQQPECDRGEARALQQFSPEVLFPGGRHPEAALSGIMLLLGCWEESHELSQDISSAEGSYWHAIVHRMEPDASNSAYWFRRVGQHGIFPDLHREASEILNRSKETSWRLKSAWDPYLFIEWCEQARQAGGQQEIVAREIQQAEWRLLFEWCAG